MVDFFINRAELIIVVIFAYLRCSARRSRTAAWKRSYLEGLFIGYDNYEKREDSSWGPTLFSLFWAIAQAMIATSYILYGIHNPHSSAVNETRSLWVHICHLAVLGMLTLYSFIESRAGTAKRPFFWVWGPLVVACLTAVTQAVQASLMSVDVARGATHGGVIAALVLSWCFFLALCWGIRNQYKLVRHVKRVHRRKYGSTSQSYRQMDNI